MQNWLWTILALALPGVLSANAQESQAMPMPHDGTMHEHHGSDAASTPVVKDQPAAMPTTGGNAVEMDASHEMAAMQGGSAPPGARDPHAYSGGYDFGPIPRPRLADEHNFGSLLVDRLESVHSDGNSAAAFDLQGWFGRDYDRAVVKAEGEVDDGRLQEARAELLWGHAITAYWDTQVGLRHDAGVDPDRNWLAFGIQGLAPYWFELGATAYVGEEGRSALRLEAEYELLFTQRLILQPRFEANFYGKRDAARELGSGLAEAVFGLRLRYEIRREFAPYVGVEWHRLNGETADFARANNEPTDETRGVIGLRAWF